MVFVVLLYLQAIQTRIVGIHIVTLGVGHSVNNRELGAIASYPPTRNSLAVSGFTNMHDVTEDLLNIFCDSRRLVFF